MAEARFSTGPLELDKILDRLADRTSFSAGRELALGLAPSADADEVERRQAETEEGRRLPTLKPNLTIGGARDIRPLTQRAGLGAVLQSVELLEVATTAGVARLWRGTLARLDDALPTLAEIAAGLEDHRPLREEIVRAIDESGEVADDASPKLRTIRGELRVVRDRVLTRLNELLNSAALRPTLQDPVVTQRNGRYVLPVRAEFRSRVKGIVHDQSASGATVFVEPLQIVEAGNRVRQLEADERHEVERILRALSGQVALARDALDDSVLALAELDLCLAKGRLADEMDATRPRLHRFPRTGQRPIVRLLEARHPLLRGEIVPLTLELGGDFDLLVITGPNTGGKTVALKTVGLLQLMAQAGLQIPAAAGSELAVFGAVNADIGDEQSIEQSLSTFSSHVTHIVEMLRHVDACTLVLLDELGAGTDPQEGSALARAILGHLRERGAIVVATTHYSELKAFAHTAPRIENASVEFDLATLAPTYRLLVGVPGQSNALAIAARLGLPPDVVEGARAFLSPEAVETEALLGEIQRERAQAEAATRQARRQTEEAGRLRNRLRDELRQSEQARHEVLRQARAESEQLLAELRREAERRLAELARVGADRTQGRAVAEAVERLQPLPAPRAAEIEGEPELGDPGPTEIRVGAEVIVPRLGVPARVLSVASNGDAELEVRGMRVRVRGEELADARAANRADRAGPEGAVREPPLREPPAHEPPLLVRGEAAPAAPPIQLDLRGLRRDEAAETLDRYLNDAYLAGLPAVRVVHGKGSGAVRTAVREQLGGHPLVKTFAPADPRQGGDGATEVALAV